MKTRPSLSVLIILLSASLPFFTVNPSFNPVGAQAYNSELKNIRFYFHYSAYPVFIVGAGTHYVMNTSALFSNPQPLIKAIGQPKIQVDFYLNPPLAAAVTFRGDWKVHVWVNASALKPAGWNLQFWERSPDGGIVWDSGVISPDVVGGPTGNPGYVDVQIFGYMLTARGLEHTFKAGNVVEVEVTLNTGSAVAAMLWYDSATFQSFAVFPSEDYATPTSLATFDANGSRCWVFSTLWSAAQRRVIVRSEVKDPFGGYDVNSVRLSITNPFVEDVASNQAMTRINGTAASYSSFYEGVWMYPVDAKLGTYTVKVDALDNSGNTQTITGTFSMGVQYPIDFRVLDSHGEPLIHAVVRVELGGLTYASGETNTSGWVSFNLFSAGYTLRVFWDSVEVASQPLEVAKPLNLTVNCAVYYPVFHILDYGGQPLDLAWVFITFPNGSAPQLPYIMNETARISFTQAPAGNYGFKVFWKDVLVNEVNIPVNSDGPYSMRSRVFKVNLKTLDNEGGVVVGAYVVATSEKEVVFNFDATNGSGHVLFRLPVGVYTLRTYWDGVLVNQTRLEADQDKAFTVECQVYKVIVNATDNNNVALKGAYVTASTIQSRVYGFAVTDASGLSNFTLPVGVYRIRLYFEDTYWLTHVENQTEVTVSINSRTVVPIRVANYPPPLWSTIGFWLITAPLVTLAAVTLYILVKRRRTKFPQ